MHVSTSFEVSAKVFIKDAVSATKLYLRETCLKNKICIQCKDYVGKSKSAHFLEWQSNNLRNWEKKVS
jgi:hypothetical protein